MANDTQDSFSISEFVSLDGKIDQFDNSFKILSTISSANFDGVIPEEILSYPAAFPQDLVPGRYILIDDTFCLITTIYDNIDASTTDTLSYDIFYVDPDGSEQLKTINVGANSFTDGTQLTVKRDDWDSKVLGEAGWSLTTEGNSIFSNVAVRGRIEATEGYFDGFLVVGDPDDPTSPGGMKIGTGISNEGANDGIYINTNNYWYDTGLFSIGNGTAGVVWNGSSLAVTGQITATSGTFTGTVNANAGSFTSTVVIGGATSGTLEVGSGTNKIKIIGTSLDSTTYINSGSTTPTTGNGFYFGADGKVRIASSTNSLTFDGTNLNIVGGGTFTGALSGGTISIGSGENIFKADSNGIYLGSETFANAEFKVTPAGALTATSGTIGGWSLSATELFSGTGSSRVSFNSSTGVIAVGTGNHGSIETGFYADKDGKFSLSNQLIFTPVIAAGRSNLLTTGTFTTGSPRTITVASATGIGKGMTVIGTGIASGTTVTNVVGTTITISNDVLSNQTGIDLSFILDDMSELSVTGRIKGIIESVTPITSPRLFSTITNANVTGTSPNQTVTFTTDGHSFLPNEKIYVEGLPGTNGLSNLNNREYVISTVPDSITITFSISGVTEVITSSNSSLNGTVSLRELTMGLHPAEGVNGTDSWYHSAGTGIRLDKFNWWLTNNQFRVGTFGSFFNWNGSKFTIQGSGTKTLSFNVGSLDADNILAIVDIGSNPTHNTTTTPFYVDGAGKFSLGQKLVWTPATSTLAIDGTVTIGGTAGSTVVSNASAGAEKPDVYRQDAEPTGTIKTGSIWYDTNDNNKTYVYSGSAWLLTEINAVGVGLGNVSNLTPQDQTQTGLIAGTTITGGGITINSGTASIKGGQSDFDTGTGFFLGYSGGAHKFSIGNASGNKLTWNGSELAITGVITSTSGTIGGWTLLSPEIFSGSGASKVSLNSSTGSISIGTGTVGAGDTKMTLDKSGISVSGLGSITPSKLSMDPARYGVIFEMGTGPGYSNGGSFNIRSSSGYELYRTDSPASAYSPSYATFLDNSFTVYSEYDNEAEEYQPAVFSINGNLFAGQASFNGNVDIPLSSLTVGGTTFTQSIQNNTTIYSDNVALGGKSTSPSELEDGVYLHNSGYIVPTRNTTVASGAALYVSNAGTISGVWQGIRFLRYLTGSSLSSTGSINVANSTSVAPVFAAGSDYRLKKNITDAEDNFINIIKSLRPIRYDDVYVEDAKNILGFIAHEVQPFVPEAIEGEKDAIDEDGNPEYQTLAQAKFVPYLIGALKQSIEKIEDLENRLAALES